MQGIGKRHKNKYTNDFLKEVQLSYIDHVLKSAKDTSVKTNQKYMKTLHTQLLFEATTES